MSCTLENLPAALVNQFQTLVNNPQESAKTNNQEYKISNIGVTVLVKMTRTASREIPKGAAFCGGKLCEDLASVLVYPPNNDVESAIATHFKNQIIPAMMMAPPMNQFDNVVVNNKKII
jgi:hypothetical protein